MTIEEAIEARHSVRAYKEQPLAENVVKVLEEKIAFLNQQRFSFEYVGMKDGHHQVHAKKGFSMIGYTQMDLGIAKYHFESGAGKENFEWI